MSYHLLSFSWKTRPELRHRWGSGLPGQEQSYCFVGASSKRRVMLACYFCLIKKQIWKLVAKNCHGHFQSALLKLRSRGTEAKVQTELFVRLSCRYVAFDILGGWFKCVANAWLFVACSRCRWVHVTIGALLFAAPEFLFWSLFCFPTGEPAAVPGCVVCE